MPPKAERSAILKEIKRQRSALDRAIVTVKSSTDRLREFRSALITAVVTGQIDPADWRRRGEGDRTLDRIGAEMAS